MSGLRRWCQLLRIALILGVLTGCAAAAPGTGGIEMSLSWQDAKARTQERELSIAATIPGEWVAETSQLPEGTLLSCSETAYSWNGATTVRLDAGAHAEAAVRAIEARYRGVGVEVGTRRNVRGQYEVQLRWPHTGESYVIAEDRPGTVRIASASACFTLPEGAYPGGVY